MTAYAFDDFLVDTAARRLTRAGATVALPDRHLGVLIELVSHPRTVLSKDALIERVWCDVAVTDNSLEQAISALRRLLGRGPDEEPWIQTVARQGYRFVGEVAVVAARTSDEALDTLLAPHRAWLEGRASLETLERDQIAHARGAFERVLAAAPEMASAHIGLANACVMHFESTRTDAAPDADALDRATRHAREACRLAPDYAEAWATLGFVLDRGGRRIDALAASRRALTLEPDNWRHHFRHGLVSWGEERLRAAQRTRALLPGFPQARWLAATVYVARGALEEAARELEAGVAVREDLDGGGSRFSSVGLYWLLGLIRLAQGDEERALAMLMLELDHDSGRHLYARECCANTWYAIGVLHRRRGRVPAAAEALAKAVGLVPAHPLASVLLGRPPAAGEAASRRSAVERALVHAAALTIARRDAEAARVVDAALAESGDGSGGWLVPVEPLLDVASSPSAWSPVLARLRARAA